MKILQIVNPVIPFPPTTIGGTERVVQYLIDDLIRSGHEVTLMAHNDSVTPAGVKFIPIGTYQDQERTFAKIWKHLLFNHYDVIHNHGRLLYFLPRVWSGTRKVHTFHMADLETRSFRRFLRLRPRNFTFSPCAAWIQDKYKHLSGHWQYVYNGLPKDAYSFNGHSPGVNAPLVIICRIGEGKGVTDAIEIARKTNRKLIIAGRVGDYPHEREWFEQNIKKHCDGLQIRFAGEVSDPEKQSLLENAAGLLMLSVGSEAFNLTMIEANACGCPVLTYDRYFGPDFIKPGINGFIGSTQQDLIDAAGRLATIDRAKCRQDFEENFTAERMTCNYLKLYHSKV